ncbi:MAG: hypothetical protein A2Y53_00075 [Chloroflexi bacterium RBG_16_47_49]|nr:MAG: hypothetical protein A2Y53_00075 [Chloroflexi bacterium RBG_16_47_49]
MSEREKIKLAVKAIRSYAQQEWGWGAKYHPDQREKYDACMEVANRMESGSPLIDNQYALILAEVQQ